MALNLIAKNDNMTKIPQTLLLSALLLSSAAFAVDGSTKQVVVSAKSGPGCADSRDNAKRSADAILEINGDYACKDVGRGWVKTGWEFKGNQQTTECKKSTPHSLGGFRHEISSAIVICRNSFN